jgi:signal transduction histidine kinase
VFQPEEHLEDLIPEPPATGRRATPVREGLPPSYRMRADAHYVDWLAAGPQMGRDQMLDPRTIEIGDTPPLDRGELAPLTESIQAHGMLQPLLVQKRDDEFRLIEGAARLSASIAAGLRKVPCLVYEVDDDRAHVMTEAARAQATPSANAADLRPTAALADAAAANLARSLGALALCADMVSPDASPLSRMVAADLIKAEVWRATCLLQAARALQGDLRPTSRPVSVRRLMERAAADLAPERRLRGFTLDDSVEIPEGSFVLGDEALLSTAISTAAIATLTLLEGLPGPTLILRASATSDLTTIEIAQSHVAAPDDWLVRAFDRRWVDRPGGAASALALSSVQVVADVHGGRATVSAAGRGTSIVIAMPAGMPTRRSWH